MPIEWLCFLCGRDATMSLRTIILLLASVLPILAISYKALESGRECD